MKISLVLFLQLIVAGLCYGDVEDIDDDPPFIEGHSCISKESEEEESPYYLKPEKNVFMYDLRLNEDFDPRNYQAWIACKKIMEEVPKQGRCGDCWAHVSALTISQRICINSLTEGNNAIVESLSTRHLSTCGIKDLKINGCDGTNMASVSTALAKLGILTGSTSRADVNGCQPYLLPSCTKGDDDYPGCKGLPDGKVLQAGECVTTCDDPFIKDNTPRAHDWRGASHGSAIRVLQEEIKRGPIIAQIFTKDTKNAFRSYKGGLFSIKKKYYDKGQRDHYVAIIGFNTTAKDENEHYWLITNTWGKNWGEGGFGKIALGKNMLFIESETNFFHPKTRVAIPGRQVHIHHPHSSHLICHSIRNGAVCQRPYLKVSGYNMRHVLFGCLDQSHPEYQFYKANPYAEFRGNYSRTINERVRVPVICA